MHELALNDAVRAMAQAGTAAAVYAAFGYLKNRQRGESFDRDKLAATLVIGLFLGFIAVYTHQELTQEWVSMQILAYAGAVTIVEDAIKAGREWYSGDE